MQSFIRTYPPSNQAVKPMSFLCNLQSFTKAPLLTQNVQSYFDGKFDMCTILWRQFIKNQGKHPIEYSGDYSVCSSSIRKAAK